MNEEDVQSLEDYFRLHPEEEDGYYDFMAEMYMDDEPIEYPEDWRVTA